LHRRSQREGAIDYPLLIQSLRDTGYSGYLTMEIGFNRRSVDPDHMARAAFEYLKSIL
jgi:protein FrlC